MVVLIGGLLLSFLAYLVSFIISFVDLFSHWDYLMTNLFILLISQVFGFILVYFLVIPLFKARKIEQYPLDLLNSVRTGALICVTFTLGYISNFILDYLFNFLNIRPQSGYTNLILNSEHLNNPLNILLYFLPLTIGASVYEEHVYRRLLIPLMEERGMSPLIAIITSSFVFAIAHLPEDLVTGNIPGSILHVWDVFLIGLSLGLIFILTRNIIYPIIIHGALNFISFSSPKVLILGNELMNIAYYTFVYIILFLGFGVFLFGLWRYLRKRDVEWVVLIRKKTFNKIKYGSLCFLIIGSISAFIPLALDNLLLNLAIYDVLLYYIIAICSFGFLVILFLWLGTRTTYDSNKISNKLLKLNKLKKIEV